VLQLDAEVTNVLARLDERPADIVRTDNAEFERDARFLGVTGCRENAGVGDRDDDVRIDGMLARELRAEALRALERPRRVLPLPLARDQEQVDLPAEPVEVVAAEVAGPTRYREAE